MATYIKILAVCVVIIIRVSFSLVQPITHNVNDLGLTISTRFQVPVYYERVASAKNSFAEYLQNCQLKPISSLVHLYNGQEKTVFAVYFSLGVETLSTEILLTMILCLLDICKAKIIVFRWSSRFCKCHILPPITTKLQQRLY